MITKAQQKKHLNTLLLRVAQNNNRKALATKLIAARRAAALKTKATA